MLLSPYLDPSVLFQGICTQKQDLAVPEDDIPPGDLNADGEQVVHWTKLNKKQ